MRSEPAACRTEQGEQYRFFVFTCRDPRSDFRLHLVNALRRQHETWYIWMKRRPLVAGPRPEDQPLEMSLPRFLLFIGRFPRDGKVNVYFNSTNTYFPTLSLLLRLISRAGLWCLDMHDDLRYHNVGLTRRREEAIIRFLQAWSHVVVHAAPTLAELFPGSHHLGNASHLHPLAQDAAADDSVLILASFDERFDFAFVARLAAQCPAMQFHLHGWTRPGDHLTAERLKQLHEGHANIHYHGPYVTADLPGILSRYRVSLAPYHANSLMTRYIDPLRYYHCLNAGLELVSTAIPQAGYLRRWIHVVPDVSACAETLAAIRAGRLAKQPGYIPITWEQRAERLMDILRTLPRTAQLGARRPDQSPVPPVMAGSGATKQSS
jgi:hypothetical protein